MTSRDPRHTLVEEQSLMPYDELLLARTSDHERYHDYDHERVGAQINGGLSRQSSLEFTDPPFKQIPLQGRATWSTKIHRYVSSLALPVRVWNSSVAAIRARSRSLGVGLFFIAIILMVLSVSFSISSPSHAHRTNNVFPSGFVHFFLAVLFPDQTTYFVDHWGEPGKISKDLLRWPTDFSRDIQPVPCHSHNDYWRKIPLYSALQAGCISIEADVWLAEDDLHVGHSRSSLTSTRTFRNLYINPLLDLLAKQNPTTNFHPDRGSPPNGVFDTAPAQTVVLLVDFKTDGHVLWPYVHAQLEPLRQAAFLTSFDGTSVIERPVTVVATGNAPFDLLVANSTYRDIFFDAPLGRMGMEGAIDSSSFNSTNSFYASTSFGASIGSVWSSPSAAQLKQIRAQIKAAHSQGLKARYWETPSWPRGLRNHVWNILVKEGVDVLNVDDLRAATQGTWGNWD